MSIPNKLYFRIGEVADILQVKPYVLRYWETEFADIRPAKSKSGQRLYKRRDVEFLLQVKTLLYQERFTIDGARKRLKEQLREARHNGQNGHSSPVENVPSASSVAPVSVSERPQLDLLAKAKTVAKSADSSENKKLLLKLRKELETVLTALQT